MSQQIPPNPSLGIRMASEGGAALFKPVPPGSAQEEPAAQQERQSASLLPTLRILKWLDKAVYVLSFVCFLIIYLFIFSCTLGMHCCKGFLQLPCAGFSLLWLLLLRSTGCGCVGFSSVAHGLSGSVACGIFLDQRSNPCPLHWRADSQPLDHQRSPYTLLV